MGAYYTPPAVVNFIVRSVDHLLKKFNLAAGFGDTAKTKEGLHKVKFLTRPAAPSVYQFGDQSYLWPTGKIRPKGRWPAYVHHGY